MQVTIPIEWHASAIEPPSKWQTDAWAVADETDEPIISIYRDGQLYLTCSWQGFIDFMVIERPRKIDVTVRTESS